MVNDKQKKKKEKAKNFVEQVLSNIFLTHVDNERMKKWSTHDSQSDAVHSVWTVYYN